MSVTDTQRTGSTDKKGKIQKGSAPKSKVCGDLHKTSDEVLGRNDLLVDRAVVGDN